MIKQHTSMYIHCTSVVRVVVWQGQGIRSKDHIMGTVLYCCELRTQQIHHRAVLCCGCVRCGSNCESKEIAWICTHAYTRSIAHPHRLLCDTTQAPLVAVRQEEISLRADLLPGSACAAGWHRCPAVVLGSQKDSLSPWGCGHRYAAA